LDDTTGHDRHKTESTFTFSSPNHWRIILTMITSDDDDDDDDDVIVGFVVTGGFSP
jgi:hypothetical protein